MIQKRAINQLPNKVFAQLGWDYFVSAEAADYLTTDLVQISEVERDAFYEAGNHIYELFVAAGEYVLVNNLLDKLGISRNLHQLIRLSWERDAHLHLFGRFDFAGGVSGLPIKLMEFNADTPTSLPETAIIQWAQLRANNLPEDAQLNVVFDALVANFRRLADLNPDRERAILFSTMRDTPEDENNVSLLKEAAIEAGFDASFCYVDEVVFSDVNGIFGPDSEGDNVNFPFWFKLVPWEYIAEDEPKLCEQLTTIVRKDLAIILNPAYTMLFQSKGMLKYLWDLFPNEPLLLEADFKEPIGRGDYPFVRKVFFGREGSNVSVFDGIGLPTDIRSGDYGNQPVIYQAYADLARDSEGQYYQAGVFFAYETCGLGFRRSTSKIIDNAAQFVGHIVQ